MKSRYQRHESYPFTIDSPSADGLELDLLDEQSSGRGANQQPVQQLRRYQANVWLRLKAKAKKRGRWGGVGTADRPFRLLDRMAFKQTVPLLTVPERPKRKQTD